VEWTKGFVASLSLFAGHLSVKLGRQVDKRELAFAPTLHALVSLAARLEAHACEDSRPMLSIAAQDLLHAAELCRRLGILVGCRRLEEAAVVVKHAQGSFVV
jgi:hypothetical protein